MFAAIVAVLGTRAGALLTGVLAHVSQRAERRAAESAARRAEGLVAVTELVTALADHRRAMWVREDLRLRGEDWTEARAESHATRSALTTPLLRVSLLLPFLAQPAQDAARAVYGLREASGQTALAEAREHAIRRADALVEAAGAALAAERVGH
ncbi:protein kilB [Streptomyces sp. RM72]|uniref:protein kilB n=1 Tax=Streptomyces sp. RM72 TaxID=1115510 RepID=UPI001B39C1CA|nr:protein kilB [Streptomyces sp. RM72]MBQ0891321.1 protein kilB [Streptomyces sp. RM72]